ncbi:MAG: glutamate 5-kinase [Promethearchaeota archaeon]
MVSSPDKKFDISNLKRIVVKIGTKSLLLNDKSFDFKTIAAVVHDIKILVKEMKKEVVLVTSGAVSAGMKKLGLESRPRDLVMQQVCASVGNPLLLNEYVRMFDDTPVAQILLTQQDLSNRKSYIHFLNAMEMLLKKQIIPIVNENDVVSIDELVGTRSGESGTDYNFSDNDVLSALVAASIEADMLIILSDVEGLYTKHPNSKNAKFIPFVDKIDEKIWKMASQGGKLGRGGMVTKLKAARICMLSGVWMVIAHAKKSEIMKILNFETKFTLFKPKKRIPHKKLWLFFAANVEGRIIIDDGATSAIKKGASMLLPGIKKVTGEFNKGDVVELVNENTLETLGKGITNYSSQEIVRFINLYRNDPEQYKKEDIKEVIHRDKMSFLA